MTIRTLYLHFDLPLFHRQIPQWRSAFAELAGLENDLFHNHRNDVAWMMMDQVPLMANSESGVANDSPLAVDDNGVIRHEKYHYRYPLIQYRIRQGKAAIFALNEGIEATQQALSNHAWQINWEGSPRPLLVTGMQMNEHTLRLIGRPRTYCLYKWLALNEDNYARWQRCQSLGERIALLERILTAQIITLAKGIGWQIPDLLEVRIQHLQQTQRIVYRGTNLVAFNIAYTANVLLPPHIALGKAVSHGFGWQVPVGKGRRG